MTTFFTAAYNFFKSRRAFLFIAVLIIVGVASFQVSRIQMKEDITEMLPDNESSARLNFMLNNSRFLEKMVILISVADSAAQSPTTIIEFANRISDSLKSEHFIKYIHEVEDKIPAGIITDQYDHIISNLPVYLTEQDYVWLDSLLKDENMGATVKRNYKTLLTPASSMMKKFIAKDISGISGRVFKRLENLQLESSFIVKDEHLFTKDEKNLLVFVIPDLSANETSSNAIFLEELDVLFDALQRAEGGKFSARYYGALPIAVGNSKQVKSDLIITMSIAILLIIVVLFTVLKKPSVFLVIFLPSIFGGIVSLAFIQWFSGSISVISLGMGAALIGITADYAIHYFTHFKRVQDPVKVVRDLVMPIVLSSLTTAAAFLCLLYVSSRSLHGIGIFASISVLAAALFALLVLPHLVRKKVTASDENENVIVEKTKPIIALDRKWLAVLIIFAGAGPMWYLASGVDFEDDMSKYNFMDENILDSRGIMQGHNDTTTRNMFLIHAGNTLDEAIYGREQSNSFLDSLQIAGAIEKYTDPGVVLVSLKEQNKRIALWNSYWSEKRKAEKIHSLDSLLDVYGISNKLLENFSALIQKKYSVIPMDSLIEKNALVGNYYIDTDTTKALFTILKTKKTEAERVEKSVVSSPSVFLFEKDIVMKNLLLVVRSDYSLLLRYSLIVVFIILLLVYGRIELTLIMYIPLVVGWIWTLGLMGLFGLKYTVFNIIVTTFIFGLGIDYCVFIMQGLVQRYKFGVDNLRSYQISILLSAATTIIGFGVMAFAKHPALNSMAYAAIIGIVSVVISAFTLQPLLFRWFVEYRGKNRNVPLTLIDNLVSIYTFLLFLIGVIYQTLLGLVLFGIIPNKSKRLKYIYHVSLMWVSRYIIYAVFTCRKKVIDKRKDTFTKPAILVCNHQSHIDVLMVLMLHPKIVVLTNNWVQNNIFYGKMIRYADFYNVSENGYEEALSFVTEKVNDGYSVLVFPEGSRSADQKIKRFHKGAFYLAEVLKMDIQPLLIHGIGSLITKGEPILKSGQATIKILPRILATDNSYGTGYREVSKNIRRMYAKEYENLRKEIETPEYHFNRLLRNYLYKGPILEWYLRIKVKMEDYYRFFHELLPLEGRITDMGCGYGFLPYMLTYLSEQRVVTGIDYDEEKINVASKSITKGKNLEFFHGDAVYWDYEKSDAIILNDILHYLPQDDQQRVIRKSVEALNPEGILVIRDGNSERGRKHWGTRYTEFMSTRILKFNKTVNKLHFTSRTRIMDAARDLNCDFELVDKTTFTSNEIYILRKRKTA